MRIVITGAEGFIGKNLRTRLTELGYTNQIAVTRDTETELLHTALADADFVYHLAGVNRPGDQHEFTTGNVELTERVCDVLASTGRRIPLVLSSSIQAALENPYGDNKRAAEQAVLRYRERTDAPVYIFRLPNVFGKWARPNYNSAVATFCYNITRGLPITVNDPTTPLKLVYIDDVVAAFTRLLDEQSTSTSQEVGPTYQTTVGEVAELIRQFAESRTTLITPPVGTGLRRALYSTYVSYLPPSEFSYRVPRHGDTRGVFVEMMKTTDCGQFSYFTAHPGVTRGEHYHHSKTEKFLVIKGTARFAFRHIHSGETYELLTRGGEATIVETSPGWTHNITNTGDEELIVMLWANEVFDREKPDTTPMKVES